jgi:CubicO group peptidase (beta-lactamase class C family)
MIATTKRHQFRASIAAAGIYLSLCFLAATDAATTLKDSSLDQFLQHAMSAGAVPGMALAVVSDGKVSLAKGYGMTADGHPFTADTPMLIASLSKAMTAAVALMLVAEGRIDLDAPVKRYLPEFRVQAPDGGAAITVRHLLNHTSGLSDPGFPDMRMAQPTTLTERVASLRTARPENPPGAQFHYFNSNYALVARIVEVVSGKPFEDVLDERLFKPLGMTATGAVPSFAAAQVRMPPPATGHVVAYGHAWRWHEPGGFISGHGGVISTATDMSRWLHWQMTGQPDILRPELVALMQTPPALSSYAMGWFRQTTNGETTLWHDGVFSTVYADVVFKPDRRLGAVLLYGVGGALLSATTFPMIRTGVLAIADGASPPLAGRSLVTIGRWASLVMLILVVASLIDLAAVRRWRSWARTAPTWRIAVGLAIRLLPIALLLSLPWVLQFASGRAFSFEAIFFAMLDATVGLACLGTILALSALLRLAFFARGNLRPRLVDAGIGP